MKSQILQQLVDDVLEQNGSSQDRIAGFLALKDSLDNIGYSQYNGLLHYWIANRYCNIGNCKEAIPYAEKAINLYIANNNEGYRLYNSVKYAARGYIESNQNQKAHDILNRFKAIPQDSSIKAFEAFVLSQLVRVDIFNSEGRYNEELLLNKYLLNQRHTAELRPTNLSRLLLAAGRSLVYSQTRPDINEFSVFMDLLQEQIDNSDLRNEPQFVSDKYLTQEHFYLKHEQYDSVVSCTNSFEKYLDRNDIREIYNNDLALHYSNSYLAEILNKRYKLAFNYIDKSYDLLGRPEIPRGYTDKIVIHNYAEGLGKNSRYDEAHALLNNVYLNLDKDENSIDPYLVTFLSDKAILFADQYLNESNENTLDSALSYFAKFETVVDKLLYELNFDDSIITWKADITSVYRYFTDLAFTINDDELMMYIAISSQSFLLNFEKIYRNDVRINGIRKRIDSLRIEKTKVQFENRKSDQIYKLNSDSTEVLLNIFEADLLNELRTEKGVAFLDEGELNNSAFNAENSVVVFLQGVDHYYALRVDKGQKAIFRIGRVAKINQMISKYRMELSKKNKSISVSSELFDIIMNPLENLNDTLIIFPSGDLHYLSLDGLFNRGKGTYVLQNHTISYMSSFSQSKNTNRPSTFGQIAVISPVYDSTSILDLTLSYSKEGEAKFEHLQFSQYESEQLNNLFKTKMNNTITKDSFEEILSKNNIVHFTGHGFQDNKDYGFSYLALSDNPNQLESILPVIEIERMETQADLIFLNACNTGMGDLQKGEGIYSLAKSFFRAGAKSVIQSLWSIDDQSSSQITLSFYKYLKAGHTKSYSLAQAKRDYFNSDIPEYKKHPYYWAGLVLVGNDAPLKFANWYDDYILPTGIFFLAGLSFLGYRKLAA